MSNAIRCDVCNKCFAPQLLTPEENFITIKNMLIQTRSDYNSPIGPAESYLELDLCPDCTRKCLALFDKEREVKADEEDARSSDVDDCHAQLELDPALVWRALSKYGRNVFGQFFNCEGETSERKDEPPKDSLH